MPPRAWLARRGARSATSTYWCSRSDIRRAENALLNAGWEWVKSDPYDDFYYREHMHELPPLIHKSRDRMIDVHHTILPRTHRITPDALALVSDAVASTDGFAVLNPAQTWRATAPRICLLTAICRAGCAICGTFI